MSPSRAERFRRSAAWLAPTALLALAPKCILCALAYAGLGAAVGLGGPEICGAAAGEPASWALPLSWLGVVAGVGATAINISRRRANRHTRAPA
jgi:hypothetical protein